MKQFLADVWPISIPMILAVVGIVTWDCLDHEHDLLRPTPLLTVDAGYTFSFADGWSPEVDEEKHIDFAPRDGGWSLGCYDYSHRRLTILRWNADAGHLVVNCE